MLNTFLAYEPGNDAALWFFEELDFWRVDDNKQTRYTVPEMCNRWEDDPEFCNELIVGAQRLMAEVLNK